MTITPESVRQLLASENFGDRIRGINQLSQLEPAIAFELVQPVICDSNDRVRYSAVSKLASVGAQNRGASLEILRDRLYNDAELDVKAAAADALGALKLTEALEDLQQLYQSSSDWIIKLSIVAALGSMEDTRGFDILQDALQAPEELVQGMAVGALGELGDERAIPLLLPFVTCDDWQMRFRVAQALGRFDDDRTREALTTLAGDKSEQVAHEAKSHLS
ncbi:HEAT repeat domain-containing protein [Oscillatoriales cyanobacterium LEGE 11467]|uniref:HEAT repeat domain-containing protein n=1 Tax=Zarconia navalis LEGE 11467 TaxID=1828826 RepID=A0A928VWV3_9CYAN|nr:HEAT repeat domain-containing protein [Zarconia navalis]MBE9040758.1 HEAT repeat domain-containing protein [Zarconia navalis LEGE 11467]